MIDIDKLTKFGFSMEEKWSGKHLQCAWIVDTNESESVLHKIEVDTWEDGDEEVAFSQYNINKHTGIDGVAITEGENSIDCSHMNADELIALCKLFGAKGAD
jgi:hypothetical protein